MKRGKSLWRGSLLPLDCAAVPNPGAPVCQADRIQIAWGRYATQREQAPSPQQRSGINNCNTAIAPEACRRRPIFRHAHHPVARKLAPAGLRSSPKPWRLGVSGRSHSNGLGLLRNPAGASSLATTAVRDKQLQHRDSARGVPAAPNLQARTPSRGEGACSRWTAQQSQTLAPRCVRQIAFKWLGVAAQPSGSKLPRHRDRSYAG